MQSLLPPQLSKSALGPELEILLESSSPFLRETGDHPAMLPAMTPAITVAGPRPEFDV